jgi:molybdopterin converting factor small subunit
MARVMVLVATRKGAWLYRGDAARRAIRVEVEADGSTLDALVDEQDRMRPHVRFFVNGAAVSVLSHPLDPTDALVIVPALSGG